MINQIKRYLIYFVGLSTYRISLFNIIFKNSIIVIKFYCTFKNPVGVITDGWTWLLHEPSHLLTATSPLQVLWSRPSSSYSSEIVYENANIIILSVSQKLVQFVNNCNLMSSILTFTFL